MKMHQRQPFGSGIAILIILACAETQPTADDPITLPVTNDVTIVSQQGHALETASRSKEKRDEFIRPLTSVSDSADVETTTDQIIGQSHSKLYRGTSTNSPEMTSMDESMTSHGILETGFKQITATSDREIASSSEQMTSDADNRDTYEHVSTTSELESTSDLYGQIITSTVFPIIRNTGHVMKTTTRQFQTSFDTGELRETTISGNETVSNGTHENTVTQASLDLTSSDEINATTNVTNDYGEHSSGPYSTTVGIETTVSNLGDVFIYAFYFVGNCTNFEINSQYLGDLVTELEGVLEYLEEIDRNSFSFINLSCEAESEPFHVLLASSDAINISSALATPTEIDLNGGNVSVELIDIVLFRAPVGDDKSTDTMTTSAQTQGLMIDSVYLMTFRGRCDVLGLNADPQDHEVIIKSDNQILDASTASEIHGVDALTTSDDSVVSSYDVTVLFENSNPIFNVETSPAPAPQGRAEMETENVPVTTESFPMVNKETVTMGEQIDHHNALTTPEIMVMTSIDSQTMPLTTTADSQITSETVNEYIVTSGREQNVNTVASSEGFHLPLDTSTINIDTTERDRIEMFTTASSFEENSTKYLMSSENISHASGKYGTTTIFDTSDEIFEMTSNTPDNDTTVMVSNPSELHEMDTTSSIMDLTTSDAIILLTPNVTSKFREDFKYRLRSRLSAKLNVALNTISVTQLSCGSVVANVTIRHSMETNYDAQMTQLSEQDFVINVLTDANETFTFVLNNIVALESRETIGTTHSVKTPASDDDSDGLSEVEIVLIIVFVVIGGTMLLLLCIFLCYKCCGVRNSKSFTLADTPNHQYYTEDFSLTKMNRPTPVYTDQGLVMNTELPHAPPPPLAQKSVRPMSVHNNPVYAPIPLNGSSLYESTSFQPSGDTNIRNSDENLVPSSDMVAPYNEGHDNLSFSSEYMLDPGTHNSEPLVEQSFLEHPFVTNGRLEASSKM